MHANSHQAGWRLAQRRGLEHNREHEDDGSNAAGRRGRDRESTCPGSQTAGRSTALLLPRLAILVARDVDRYGVATTHTAAEPVAPHAV